MILISYLVNQTPNKQDLTNMKNLYMAKDSIIKVKGTLQNQNFFFTNYHSDWDLVSKISKVINQENIPLKWSSELITQFSRDETHVKEKHLI